MQAVVAVYPQMLRFVARLYGCAQALALRGFGRLLAVVQRRATVPMHNRAVGGGLRAPALVAVPLRSDAATRAVDSHWKQWGTPLG